MPLVWTDLETTGLTAATCSILEVAAIATDDQLNEVSRFHRVVYYKGAAPIMDVLARGESSGEAAKQALLATGNPVDPYVIEMHLKNGLWLQCIDGTAVDSVDRAFAQFIQQTATVKKTTEDGKEYLDRPQLGGSTVSFDRTFINAHMPRAAACLHYRHVDVSTLNELARRFWPMTYAASFPAVKEEEVHRGMHDIEKSLSACKFYLNNLGPRG